MPYTLGQAAKAAGTSKPTLSRAIKSGRLSAQRQPDGSFLIDPAELHRVYPPVAATRNDNGNAEHHETPGNPLASQARLEVLHAERGRERQQLQATIDDLRRRLDEEAAERREAGGRPPLDGSVPAAAAQAAEKLTSNSSNSEGFMLVMALNVLGLCLSSS